MLFYIIFQFIGEFCILVSLLPCRVISLGNIGCKTINFISVFHHLVLGRLANTNLPLPNIASQTVERVTTYKLLGVHIYSTLSWSTHIEYIVKKATTRLYFLKQLKRAGLPNSHILHFYITVIRPVLEYCAPVWLYALTKAQSESLEAVQKRAVHITHNLTRGMPYSSMLLHVNLDSLATRREDLSRRFFRDIMDPASQPPSSTQIHRYHL